MTGFPISCEMQLTWADVRGLATTHMAQRLRPGAVLQISSIEGDLYITRDGEHILGRVPDEVQRTVEPYRRGGWQFTAIVVSTLMPNSPMRIRITPVYWKAVG